MRPPKSIYHPYTHTAVRTALLALGLAFAAVFLWLYDWITLDTVLIIAAVVLATTVICETIDVLRASLLDWQEASTKQYLKTYIATEAEVKAAMEDDADDR